MEEEIKKDKPAEGEETQKPLEKMTAKVLREMAKEIPGVTGVHAMKKEQLLEVVKEARSIKDEKPAEEAKGVKDEKPAEEAKGVKDEKPAEEAKGVKGEKPAKGAKKMAPKKEMGARALKDKIIALKGEKEAAQKEKDRKKIHILRRRINRIKKLTRKVAQG